MEQESFFQQGHIVYVGQYTQLPVQLGSMTLPYPLLERMIKERERHLEATQQNNHIVAISVLKSSVVSFLQFERSFKSLLSKGDDNTQIAIIRHAISELRSANQSYDSLMDKNDPCRPFVTEPTYIVDLRELFEHCIKILVIMLHLLGGRDIKTNSYEYLSQTYSSWKGWQQIAEQITLSNNVLSLLVKRQIDAMTELPVDDKLMDMIKDALTVVNMKAVDKHHKRVVREIQLFTASVSHVTESLMASKYPTKACIQEIYGNGASDIRAYMNVHESNTALQGKEMQNNTGTPKATTWF